MTYKSATLQVVGDVHEVVRGNQQFLVRDNPPGNDDNQTHPEELGLDD